MPAGETAGGPAEAGPIRGQSSDPKAFTVWRAMLRDAGRRMGSPHAEKPTPERLERERKWIDARRPCGKDRLQRARLTRVRVDEIDDLLLGMHAELSENGLGMRAHGVQRYHQLLGGGLHGVSLCGIGKHLAFSRGYPPALAQRVERGV